MYLSLYIDVCVTTFHKKIYIDTGRCCFPLPASLSILLPKVYQFMTGFLFDNSILTWKKNNILIWVY